MSASSIALTDPVWYNGNVQNLDQKRNLSTCLQVRLGGITVDRMTERLSHRNRNVFTAGPMKRCNRSRTSSAVVFV